MSEGAKFADLQTRVTSAIIMLLIGGVAIWMGGYVFSAVIVCAVGAMHWELGRMLTPLSMQAQWFSALTSVISIIWLLTTDSLIEQVVILTVATLLQRVYFHTVDRLGTLVSAGIIIGALLLIYVRNDVGIIAALWIVGIVVITDIAGYFVGRIVGGAKFWPTLSPKKTWSGIVGGWLGAMVLSYVLVHLGYVILPLEVALALALGLSFASQMGDIVESGLKRAAGVKDSSDLIPGHGGVMDRFDGLIGASLVYAVFLGVLTWI